MKGKHPWFQVYKENQKATHLSMAGGGARLLALLLTVAAVPVTAVLGMILFRMVTTAGPGMAWFFLLEEMEEPLLLAFLLWSGAILLRYGAAVCRAKAEMMAEE
ncbi:hypothetical protein H9X85_09075 [Anaerotignum lactatifermentans]|uniref:ABC transmembrane type-1 domain-containing protein n=1 Tax=Anaerotignum lactatifermentans TaxID=160404 RepID=A0ABS2G9X9_9FIRM|nr:hypothetical protein [Anaerotignum lactatifermentans]MBM6830370.1 hypothetical protein [Anaerotignum lactatifermentans]MBM6878276.1 hypothetical protein [Anaerotignum lactatifermentans]MBM6951356.1 hypothetical protein [Anaerotignum lactatifermentans]